MSQKPLLIRLCVVVLVLFCGVLLSVAETIVGSPVCCYVGIVLWSVSWCCGNHCWLACVLLCWYWFVECFLVLRKPSLVGLFVVMWVLFSVFRFSLYTISYDGDFFLLFTTAYKADRHKPRTTPDEKIMTGRIHFLWLGTEASESNKN